VKDYSSFSPLCILYPLKNSSVHIRFRLPVAASSTAIILSCGRNFKSRTPDHNFAQAGRYAGSSVTCVRNQFIIFPLCPSQTRSDEARGPTNTIVNPFSRLAQSMWQSSLKILGAGQARESSCFRGVAFPCSISLTVCKTISAPTSGKLCRESYRRCLPDGLGYEPVTACCRYQPSPGGRTSSPRFPFRPLMIAPIDSAAPRYLGSNDAWEIERA